MKIKDKKILNKYCTELQSAIRYSKKHGSANCWFCLNRNCSLNCIISFYFGDKICCITDEYNNICDSIGYQDLLHVQSMYQFIEHIWYMEQEMKKVKKPWWNYERGE